ncbi:hypothetical protein [Bacillus piscicola]|uniref:hypothetical protein n=1 Tax=Bacillus piscicola TaxID=1632684 RepID=UPI001F09609D|nr:hypothetical protein [Bacillus piscicola]
MKKTNQKLSPLVKYPAMVVATTMIVPAMVQEAPGADAQQNDQNDDNTPFNVLAKPLAFVKDQVAPATAEAADVIEIHTVQDLDNIRNNPSGHYRLMNDLDLSGVDWEPIGSYRNEFEGVLDGNGHVIKNLKIDTTNMDSFSDVGLFGIVRSAEIRNLIIENPEIVFAYDDYMSSAGFLAGKSEGGGTFSGIFIKGGTTTSEKYSGVENIGGLIGLAENMSDEILLIEKSYSDVNLTNDNAETMGGLIGWVFSTSKEQGFVYDSYSTGELNGGGGNAIGGLIGHSSDATVKRVYSSSLISAKQPDYVGGLIGYANDTVMTDSFALNADIRIVYRYDLGWVVGDHEYSTISAHILSKTDRNMNDYGVAGRISSAAAHQKQTYVDQGFDFQDTWEIDEGTSLPYLTMSVPEVAQPPAEPSLQVTDTTPNTIQLQWSDEQDATSYQLKRDGEVIYEGSGTSFTDEELQANTDYTYELVAIGEGGSSEPVTLTASTTNHAPAVIAAIDNQTAIVNDKQKKYITLDLNEYFHDEDGDTLTFSANTEDTSIATTEINGSELTIEVLDMAATDVTVVAKDGNGGKVSQTFTVTGDFVYQTVIFNWLPIYDNNGEKAIKYKVTKNGEVVATTTGYSYTDDKAVPGEMNKYGVIPVFKDGTDGQEIEIGDIEVPVDGEDVEVDPPADQDQGNNPADDLEDPTGPGVDVGKDFLRIAWDAIDGADYYEIKRNGNLIHTEEHVAGTNVYSYIDQPIDPTVSHRYEIIPYAANGDNVTEEGDNNPIPPFDVLAKPTFTEMQDADGNLLLDLSDLSNGSTVASPEAESLVLTADYHDVKEGQVAEYYTDADGWTTYNDTITLTENGDVILRVRSTDPGDNSVSAYSFLTFANIIGIPDAGDGNNQGEDEGKDDPSKDYTAIPFTITDGFRGSKVLEMEELEDGVTVELKQQDETKYDAYVRNGQANFGKVAAGTYDVYFDGAKHQDQAVIGDASGEDGSGEGDTGEPGEDLDYSTTPYEVVEGFRGSIGIRMTGLQDGETLEVTQNGEVIADATSKNTEAYFGRLQDGTYTLVINGQEHETPMVVGDAAGEDEGGTTPDGDFTALPYEVERGFRNAVLLNMEGLPKGQKVELRLDGSVIKTATSTNDKVNFGIVADGTYDLYINDKRHETPFSLQDNSDSGNDASGEDYQDTPFTVSNGFRNTINMEMEGLASGLRVELHQNGEVVASDTSSSGTANFGFVADGEYELHIQGTKHNQPFVVSAGGNGGSQPGGSDSSADYTTTPFEIVHGYRGSIGLSMEGLRDGVMFTLQSGDQVVAAATSLRQEVQFGEVVDGVYDVFIDGTKHQDTFTVGDPGAPEPEEPSLVTTPFTIKDGFRGSKTLQLEGLPKGSEVELKQGEEVIKTATSRKGNVKFRSVSDGVYDLYIDGKKHAFAFVVGTVDAESATVTDLPNGFKLQLATSRAGDVITAYDAEGEVTLFSIQEDGTALLENLESGNYKLYVNGFLPLGDDQSLENDTLTITVS